MKVKVVFHRFLREIRPPTRLSTNRQGNCGPFMRPRQKMPTQTRKSASKFLPSSHQHRAKRPTDHKHPGLLLFLCVFRPGLRSASPNEMHFSSPPRHLFSLLSRSPAPTEHAPSSDGVAFAKKDSRVSFSQCFFARNIRCTRTIEPESLDARPPCFSSSSSSPQPVGKTQNSYSCRRAALHRSEENARGLTDFRLVVHHSPLVYNKYKLPSKELTRPRSWSACAAAAFSLHALTFKSFFVHLAKRISFARPTGGALRIR